VLLLLRPLAQMAQNLVSNQAIAVNVANMIRWQNHWHVARSPGRSSRTISPAASPTA
jgi:hypothetical protein